ncbi:MAG: tetratricopeptide repeat protein [Candidatus Nitronauta litoralis]|uniref:Tetratricopeptide repeat protein n=1 Tax=Candidatus Nitronauta litoralis TaxID=2705533 RepID=A0A7T0BVR6_9BACT|nr:MAG: tetratricopeptide repeat protein [Candidatus Nitronauta litoralis]
MKKVLIFPIFFILVLAPKVWSSSNEKMVCAASIKPVDGNVKIIQKNKCGVPPKALEYLELQLGLKGKNFYDLGDDLFFYRTEIHQWLSSFQELTENMEREKPGGEKVNKILDLVNKGEFKDALKNIDVLISMASKNPKIQSVHIFNRGKILELGFKPIDALVDYKRAFLKNPDYFPNFKALVSLLLAQNKFAEAENILKQALIEGNSIKGLSPMDIHLRRSFVLNVLGNVFLSTNRLKEAEEVYLEAQQSYKKFSGPNFFLLQPNKSATMNNLGVLYKEKNQLKKAETYFKKVIKLRKKEGNEVQGGEGLSTVSAMFNLGDVYLNTYNLKNAEEMFLSAWAIQEHSFKKDVQVFRHHIKDTRSHLIYYYIVSNRFGEAEALAKRSLKEYQKFAEKYIEAYQPYIASVRTSLGAVYKATHRLQEAEEMITKGLETFKAFGKKDPAAFSGAVPPVVLELGKIFVQTLRFEKGEKYLVEALKYYRRLSKANPDVFLPGIARTQLEMGRNFQLTLRFEKAEIAFNQSYEIFNKLAKINFRVFKPYVASVKSFLASIYLETHRYEEARESLAEALEIFKEKAKVNPQLFLFPVAHTLNGIGKLYQSEEKYKEGKQAVEESLKIFDILIRKNPKAFLPDKAKALFYFSSLVYAEAKSKRREAKSVNIGSVSLFQMLNPGSYMGDPTNAINFSHDYIEKMRKLRIAEKANLESLEIFKKYSKASPQEFLPLIARGLMVKAAILLGLSAEEKQGQEFAEEALILNKKLAETNPKVFGHQLADNMEVLVYFAVANENWEKTNALLRKILSIKRTLWQVNPMTFGDSLAKTLLFIGGVNLKQGMESEEICEVLEEAYKVSNKEKLKYIINTLLEEKCIVY